MSAPRPHPHSFEDLPKAIVEKNWKTRLFWLIPLGAAGLAAYFIFVEVLSAGPTLHIFFEDAQGLEPGKTEVKYRGTQIGTVKSLRLTKDHQRVEVKVSLDRSAADVAREGSRFWIVKAELGVAQVQALQTIVSGDFVAVEPGNGRPQVKFTGLEQPPVVEPQDVVRIVLLSERRGGMKERAPVFYRGIQVGQVFKCELGPGSQTIQLSPTYSSITRPWCE